MSPKPHRGADLSFGPLVRGALALSVLTLASCSHIPNKTDGMSVPPVSQFIKRERHSKLVVFIHGLMGDASSTWTNSHSHASWPNLLIQDRDLKEYDLYSVSYFSSAFGSASSVAEIANRVRLQLIDEKIFEDYEQIHFIAHSLGGLIIKRLIATLNTPKEFLKLRRIHSAFFLGTPSKGSELAALAAWFSANRQLRGISPAQARDFLIVLDTDLRAVQTGRSESFPYPRFFCAYETLPTVGLDIVPALYSESLCDEQPLALDLDHLSLVKPYSERHEPYPWVKARILGTAGASPAVEEFSNEKHPLTDDMSVLADIEVTPLTASRISPLDGHPRLTSPLKSEPIYAGGAKVSFTLSHNNRTSHSITIYGLDLTIHSFTRDAAIAYKIDADHVFGAGTVRPHQFRYLLNGDKVKEAAWIDDKGSIKTARSSDVFDSDGSTLIALRSDTDDTAEIRGTILPENPGLYDISFKFLYSVGGHDKTKSSSRILIYKAP